MSYLSFKECCQKIIDNRNEKAVNYAVGYAQAGISMDGKSASLQILYILNNITHWRGEEAKLVRNSLKHHAGHRKFK